MPSGSLSKEWFRWRAAIGHIGLIEETAAGCICEVLALHISQRYSALK